jgi:hypothetical protein
MSKSITLAIISSIHNDFAKISLDKTLAAVDCQEVITFTDKPVSQNYKHVAIRQDFSHSDYSYFCLKNLWAFIETDFVLIVQYDGMAVKREFWTDEFLNYDYIGAPWPQSFDWISPHELVGNGGFSLRSRKLLDALRDPDVIIARGNMRTENEDAVICQSSHQLLTGKYGITYAPLSVAEQFSQECIGGPGNTLGFHGLWNMPYYFSEEEVCYMLRELPIQYWDNYRLKVFLDNCRRIGYNKAYHQIYKKLYLGVDE